MRTLKFNFLSVLLLVFSMGISQAQDVPKMYWVHEDVVKPSMVASYEKVCKDLTANLKKHNIQGAGMIVTNTVDHRYLWVSPIKSMADINYDVFKTLSEKMGGTAMSDLFDKMDKSYDTEHDYVIHLDEELSYMPDGMTQTPEGQNYRKFHYFHYTPSNSDVVKEKSAAIKKLFESKGSKLHYRTYKSGFGNKGAFYMVAIAAKDATDYATKIAENNELLGEEWAQIYGDFQASLLEYEMVEGQMRPDMAYSPSN